MTYSEDIPALRQGYLLPYRANTRQLYEAYLDRYFAWCSSTGLEPLQAGSSDIEKYVHHLQTDGHLRDSSVCTALTPLRGFYRFACREEAISRDPAVAARRPRYNYLSHDTLGLDREQMQSFLAAGVSMGGRYHATAFLLACMALRASEACSLQIGDYDRTVRGHRVLEFNGKASVPARMPLPVPVIRALDAAADGRTTGPLLMRRDGSSGLTRQGLNTLVRTLGRRAGIEQRLTSHVLRHSAVTNALESGAPLRKVMDFARHSEPRTTMRYDRNRTNLDDHAIHSLVAFVAPSEKLSGGTGTWNRLDSSDG